MGTDETSWQWNKADSNVVYMCFTETRSEHKQKHFQNNLLKRGRPAVVPAKYSVQWI